jgi:hypothetical protein
MAALHYPVAEQQNAAAAASTGGAQNVISHAATPVERFIETVRTDAGGLGFLFGHDITQAVQTPIEQATQAVRGVAGGLVPVDSIVQRSTSTPAPVAGIDVRSYGRQIREQLSTDLGSLRKALGI